MAGLTQHVWVVSCFKLSTDQKPELSVWTDKSNAEVYARNMREFNTNVHSTVEQYTLRDIVDPTPLLKEEDVLFDLQVNNRLMAIVLEEVAEVLSGDDDPNYDIVKMMIRNTLNRVKGGK